MNIILVQFKICLAMIILEAKQTLQNILNSYFIYLFLERREGGRTGGRETLTSFLSHVPNWGPVLQPRHVVCPGIKPAAFWFTGRYSIH